jgi:hypothetical protein
MLRPLFEGRWLGKVEVGVLGNRFADDGLTVAQHRLTVVLRSQHKRALEWGWGRQSPWDRHRRKDTGTFPLATPFRGEETVEMLSVSVTKTSARFVPDPGNHEAVHARKRTLGGRALARRAHSFAYPGAQDMRAGFGDGLEDLLVAMRAAGRPQDLADVMRLEKVRAKQLELGRKNAPSKGRGRVG